MRRNVSTPRALLSALATLGLFLPATPGSAGAQVSPELLSGMEARAIGPAAMSGRIAAIEGVPGDPGTVYVGAATGGVWKSTDAGTTWTPIFDDQDASSIGVITVHPANPDLVWVGTGEANLRNSSGVGRGVYRSLDGGETWEHAGLEDSEHIHRIAVHPTDPDIAYVAATGPLWNDGDQRGVYRTTDGGGTWERILAGANDRTGANEVVIDPRNPLKLFASLWEFRRWPHFFESGGPGSGLYVSHDGGDTWRELGEEEGFPTETLGRIAVDVAPSDPDVVYSLVEAETSALYHSDDGGRSWTKVNEGGEVADRPFYYHRIMVDPAIPDRVYYIHGDLDVSTDGGRSFDGIATWGDGVHVDHHALWIAPEDPEFIVDGNDGGVYISRNRGDTWRFVQNLPLAQYYEIDVDMEIPYNVYGGLQDNGSWRAPHAAWEQSPIRGYHWTEIGFGDGFGALDDPDEPRYGFSMSQEGYLRRYDLETGERKDVRPAPPADSAELRFNWNAPIAIDPHDSNTVYFGSQFVHRSTDDGLTWEVISGDLTTDDPEWQRQAESGGLTIDATGAENYTTLVEISPSPVERGVVWAGSDDGRIHVTRDGGETWSEVTDELPDEVPANPWVAYIEASHHQGGRAYVVLNDYRRGDWSVYVYRTDDYGESWSSVAGAGQVDGFARALAEDLEVPGLLFLGGEFGLWVTLDGGEGWMKWTHGFPTSPVRDLAIHPREGDLVVGTHGRGAYVLDDIRALRELARDPSLLERSLHLYPVRPAYQHTVASARVFRFAGSAMYAGENEAYGATLTFSASAGAVETAAEEEEMDGPSAEGTEDGGGDDDGTPQAEATLQILSGGAVIRTVDDVDVEPGINRYAWNLRRDGFRVPADEPEEGEDPPERSGPEVLPGRYDVRLILGPDTASGSLEIRPDPRTEVPMTARREKEAAVLRAGADLEAAADAVERLRTAKKGVRRVLDVVGGAGEGAVAGAGVLKDDGEALIERADSLLGRFVSLDEVQGITESETVTSDLSGVYGRLQSSFDAPTEAQMTVLRHGEGALAGALEEVNAFLVDEVARYRERVRGTELPMIPATETVAMPER